MATFSERAAHSVDGMLSLLYLFVALVVSQFCFQGKLFQGGRNVVHVDACLCVNV